MIPGLLQYPQLYNYPWAGDGLAAPDAETQHELEEGSRTEHWRLRAQVGPGRFVDLAVESDLSVTDSATAQPAMSLSGTIIAPRDFTSKMRSDLLHPDKEIRFHLQVGYSSPRTPLVYHPMGVYVTTSVKSSAGSRRVEVSMGDQSVVVRRRSMLERVYMLDNAGPTTSLQYLLQARCPWVELGVNAAIGTTASMWLGEPGADLWKICEDSIAKPLGCGLGFSRTGKLDMTMLSDPVSATPAFSWAVGPTSVLLTAATIDERNIDGVFTPWSNDNASGVAFYPSDTGHVVMFDGDSTLIDSPEKALTALEAYMGRLRGKGDAVSAEVWQNVRLKRDDVVELVVPDLGMNNYRARVSSVRFQPNAPMTVELVDRKEQTDEYKG